MELIFVDKDKTEIFGARDNAERKVKFYKEFFFFLFEKMYFRFGWK